jgi:excisionase family DNA binding protein
MKRQARRQIGHSPGQAPPVTAIALAERPRIPFRERPTCTIEEASDVSGIGRTKLYELIGAGQIETLMIGRRRLIRVPSLLRLLEPDQAAA